MSELVPEPFRRRFQASAPDQDAPSVVDWVSRLPRLLDDLLGDWDLRPDGATRWGWRALVVPVVSPDGPAALKVGWPHPGARHEHLALRHWAGRGVVRLLRADPVRVALLLERLDPERDLRTVPAPEAGTVVAGLLRELRRPAPPQLSTTAAYAARLAADLAGQVPGIPRRFVEQARSLAADLAADGERNHPMWLLHTDLREANVLAAQRTPWLAIDPEPLAGDRAFELARVLHDRAGEEGRAGSVRAAIRERFDLVCEQAEIDPDRAQAWTILREVADARAAARAGRADGEQVRRVVTVLKAMNP